MTQRARKFANPQQSRPPCADEVFAGGGKMGALMRSYDWSKTSLGPVGNWSSALCVTAQLVLANSFQMLLWWGPDFVQLYNDAYIPILGDKHPNAALGKPFRECWSEVYHILGPLAQTPYEGGPSTWLEDIPLEVNRFGFMEETHFTIGYSPVPDNAAPGGIGGVLATVQEITQKVINERRILVLRDLSTRSFEAKTAEKACVVAASTFANYQTDLPFTLLYLTEDNGRRARLASSTGTEDYASMKPEIVSLQDRETTVWPLAASRDEQRTIVIDDLKKRFGRLPQGPWSDPSHTAAIVPIKSSIGDRTTGFLVAGISPRLRFDDSYRGFLELISAQIGTAVSNARAYEEERRRNEALAEIDRAKTAFFTNVSHEFRTPLTLMMAPLEDALADEGDRLEIERESLESAHRNSLRLLKLVNTLLEFTRIEAGRTEAVYEPVNLAEATADLASVFRSAVERAGLELIIDCPPLEAPVYVDREMWEKIVLNLISNAFKFTFEGSIAVSLRPADDKVELRVKDTGTGIAEDDLLHVFERFYRVKQAQGRSFEGSGIGLSLVQELVKLNGGTLRVESKPGTGSTFIVSIPSGSSHLPAERIGVPRSSASTAVTADAFVQEALRWLPQDKKDESERVTAPAAASTSSVRILLAEDNSDMRDYVQRLLAGAYQVQAVGDGEAAYRAALQHPPDLVLTDVMMPKLDGFALLKALRANERTRSLPVILLSARAGEEARVEGIAASADDYLVKPFSARELVARVENNLKLSRLRHETEKQIRENEERYRAFLEASSDVVYRMNADWTEMRQLVGRSFIEDTHEPDRSWMEKYIHPNDQVRVAAAIQKAINRKSVFELEHQVLRVDGTLGWTFSRAVPLLNDQGEIVEWLGTASDVTARKASEAALLRTEKLASVGRLAASIAHEINNPLAAVTNLLYLMKKDKTLTQETKSHLNLADRELDRVSHLAKQTLGFYRDSSAPTQLDTAHEIDELLAVYDYRIRYRNITVEREFDQEAKVYAASGEFRQVFSNLFVNAVDAIVDEPGRIRIRVKRSRAWTNGQRGVSLIVADNGSGIKSKHRAKIFEPFYTTKDDVGTGLGLWLTSNIMQKYGGHIHVRSSADESHNGAPFRHGTVFSVFWPDGHEQNS